MRLHICQLYKG